MTDSSTQASSAAWLQANRPDLVNAPATTPEQAAAINTGYLQNTLPVKPSFVPPVGYDDKIIAYDTTGIQDPANQLGKIQYVSASQDAANEYDKYMRLNYPEQYYGAPDRSTLGGMSKGQIVSRYGVEMAEATGDYFRARPTAEYNALISQYEQQQNRTIGTNGIMQQRAPAVQNPFDPNTALGIAWEVGKTGGVDTKVLGIAGGQAAYYGVNTDFFNYAVVGSNNKRYNVTASEIDSLPTGVNYKLVTGMDMEPTRPKDSGEVAGMPTTTTLNDVNDVYMAVGGYQGVRVPGAKIAIDYATGEFGVYAPVAPGRKLYNLIGGGGLAAAQSGMFSVGESLWDPAHTFELSDIGKMRPVSSEYMATHSKAGAEAYAGFSRPLDNRTLDSKDIISRYGNTGNLANYVQQIAADKGVNPANIPWEVASTAPAAQYMDQTGLTGKRIDVLSGTKTGATVPLSSTTNIGISGPPIIKAPAKEGALVAGVSSPTLSEFDTEYKPSGFLGLGGLLPEMPDAAHVSAYVTDLTSKIRANPIMAPATVGVEAYKAPVSVISGVASTFTMGATDLLYKPEPIVVTGATKQTGGGSYTVNMPTSTSISGGNQTITALGTWLDQNAGKIDRYDSKAVADYNSKVDQFMAMQAQNPTVITTKGGTMTTTTGQYNTPQKIYANEWERYVEGSGRVARWITGLSLSKQAAYYETIKNQEGLGGEVKRGLYFAGTEGINKPAELPIAAASAAIFMGGLGVAGGAANYLSYGGGLTGKVAGYAVSPTGSKLLSAGLGIGLTGLYGYGVTEGGTATAEKTKENIYRSAPSLVAMYAGGGGLDWIPKTELVRGRFSEGTTFTGVSVDRNVFYGVGKSPEGANYFGAFELSNPREFYGIMGKPPVARAGEIPTPDMGRPGPSGPRAGLPFEPTPTTSAHAPASPGGMYATPESIYRGNWVTNFEETYVPGYRPTMQERLMLPDLSNPQRASASATRTIVTNPTGKTIEQIKADAFFGTKEPFYEISDSGIMLSPEGTPAAKSAWSSSPHTYPEIIYGRVEKTVSPTGTVGFQTLYRTPDVFTDLEYVRFVEPQVGSGGRATFTRSGDPLGMNIATLNPGESELFDVPIYGKNQRVVGKRTGVGDIDIYGRGGAYVTHAYVVPVGARVEGLDFISSTSDALSYIKTKNVRGGTPPPMSMDLELFRQPVETTLYKLEPVGGKFNEHLFTDNVREIVATGEPGRILSVKIPREEATKYSTGFEVGTHNPFSERGNQYLLPETIAGGAKTYVADTKVIVTESGISWNTGKTGLPLWDSYIGNKAHGVPAADMQYEASLTWMHPQDYISTQIEIFGMNKIPGWTGRELFYHGLEENNVAKITAGMYGGDVFDALAIERNRFGGLENFQEGRHRSVAALRAGAQRIPVWEIYEKEILRPGMPQPAGLNLELGDYFLRPEAQSVISSRPTFEMGQHPYNKMPAMHAPSELYSPDYSIVLTKSEANAMLPDWIHFGKETPEVLPPLKYGQFEKQATAYTAMWFDVVNNILRYPETGLPKSQKYLNTGRTEISAIKAARTLRIGIEKFGAPIEEPAIYRGLSGSGAQSLYPAEDLKPGHLYEDYGIQSFTKRPDVAEAFTDRGHGAILEIVNPSQYPELKGIDTTPFSLMEKEAEYMIYQPGFRVNAIRTVPRSEFVTNPEYDLHFPSRAEKTVNIFTVSPALPELKAAAGWDTITPAPVVETHLPTTFDDLTFGQKVAAVDRPISPADIYGTKESKLASVMQPLHNLVPGEVDIILNPNMEPVATILGERYNVPLKNELPLTHAIQRSGITDLEDWSSVHLHNANTIPAVNWKGANRPSTNDVLHSVHYPWTEGVAGPTGITTYRISDEYPLQEKIDIAGYYSDALNMSGATAPNVNIKYEQGFNAFAKVTKHYGVETEQFSYPNPLYGRPKYPWEAGYEDIPTITRPLNVEVVDRASPYMKNVWEPGMTPSSMPEEFIPKKQELSWAAQIEADYMEFLHTGKPMPERSRAKEIGWAAQIEADFMESLHTGKPMKERQRERDLPWAEAIEIDFIAGLKAKGEFPIRAEPSYKMVDITADIDNMVGFIPKVETPESSKKVPYAEKTREQDDLLKRINNLNPQGMSGLSTLTGSGKPAAAPTRGGEIVPYRGGKAGMNVVDMSGMSGVGIAATPGTRSKRETAIATGNVAGIDVRAIAGLGTLAVNRPKVEQVSKLDQMFSVIPFYNTKYDMSQKSKIDTGISAIGGVDTYIRNVPGKFSITDITGIEKTQTGEKIVPYKIDNPFIDTTPKEETKTWPDKTKITTPFQIDFPNIRPVPPLTPLGGDGRASGGGGGGGGRDALGMFSEFMQIKSTKQVAFATANRFMFGGKTQKVNKQRRRYT